MQLSYALTVLGLASSALGHFVLNYPSSLGWDEDIEGQAPCGGFPVKFAANDTNVPVDSFAVAMLSTHPQAQWLFRATVSQQAPYNWTNLLPVVEETGLGHFCLPTLKAPGEFVGKSGLVQVIQDAADGVLYQCAAVNFIAGANTTVGATCVNATGLTATVGNQNQFQPSSTTSNPSSTGSATGSAAPTSSSGTASGLKVGVIPGFFALVVASIRYL